MNCIEIPNSLYQVGQDRFLFQTEDLEFVRYTSHKKTTTNEVRLEKNLLLFVRSGTKTVRIYNEYTTIPANSGAFIPKGSYLMTELSNGSNCIFESMMVLISDKLFYDTFQDIAQGQHMQSVDPVKSGNEMSPWAPFEGTPFLDAVLDTLDSYFLSPESVHSDYLTVKLKEIFLYLLNGSKCSSNLSHLAAYIGSSQRNISMKRFMEKNYTQPWTIERYAEHYGLSLSTFKREFNEVFGESPRRWIKRYRSKSAASK